MGERYQKREVRYFRMMKVKQNLNMIRFLNTFPTEIIIDQIRIVIDQAKTPAIN